MTNPSNGAKIVVQGKKRAKSSGLAKCVEQTEKGGKYMKYMLLSIAYCYDVVKDEKEAADSIGSLLNSYFG
ncbi:MAG: hypothetical protein J1F28_07480 [Oscillospiraceae bacterium]|nr:hypothetical protein [Oscillospiraceae bacterium]